MDEGPKAHTLHGARDPEAQGAASARGRGDGVGTRGASVRHRRDCSTPPEPGGRRKPVLTKTGAERTWSGRRGRVPVW
ncbi:MAG: hypothetical protein Kow00122_17200 [Thermoleophilia bacterium]